MSKISLTPNASGTGTFTIESPNSNTNRTLTLPDVDGALLTSADIPAPPAPVDVNYVYLHNLTTDKSIPTGGVFNKNFTTGSYSGFDVSVGTMTRRILGDILVPPPTSSSTTVATVGDFTITSSVTMYTANDLIELFDSQAGTYGEQYTNNSWTVTVDLGSAKELDGYTITRFSSSVYQPRAWSFQYSDNGSSWTTVDSYNSTTDWGVNSLVRDITNSSHRYWRWVFTANNGAPSTGYVISGLSVDGPVVVDPVFTSSDFTAASAPDTASLALKATGLSSAPVSGSDIQIEVSRDNGTTWSIVDFDATSLDNVEADVFYLKGSTSLTSQPSGVDMKYRIKFFGSSTNEPATITGVVFEWE